MSSGRRPDLCTVSRPVQYTMQNHNVKSMETTDMAAAAARDLHTLHPIAAGAHFVWRSTRRLQRHVTLTLPHLKHTSSTLTDIIYSVGKRLRQRQAPQS